MYCKYCGKQIDDNSQFCKFCGKKLVETKKVSIEFTKPNIDVHTQLNKTLSFWGKLKNNKKNKHYFLAIIVGIIFGFFSIGITQSVFEKSHYKGTISLSIALVVALVVSIYVYHQDKDFDY